MNGFLPRWAPLLIGLAIGLALGLAYTWVINPVEITNTYPPLLRTDYRWDWVRLAALSYAADGDLGRARARLSGIPQADISGSLQALIEEYAAAGRPADTLRSLSTLAQTLGVDTPAMRVYLQTPAPTPSPTRTPSPLPPAEGSPMSTPHIPAPPPPTAAPTLTPTPTPLPSSAFRLAGQEQICEPGAPLRIEVIVQDEDGEGMAGVEVWLMWPGGADRAVTGLKPEKGTGYADFSVEPGVSYDLGTSELGVPLASGLLLKSCPAQEGEPPVPGSWRIVLEPRPPADEPVEATRQP